MEAPSLFLHLLPVQLLVTSSRKPSPAPLLHRAFCCTPCSTSPHSHPKCNSYTKSQSMRERLYLVTVCFGLSLKAKMGENLSPHSDGQTCTSQELMPTRTCGFSSLPRERTCWHCLNELSLFFATPPGPFLFLAKLYSWVCISSVCMEHYSTGDVTYSMVARVGSTVLHI